MDTTGLHRTGGRKVAARLLLALLVLAGVVVASAGEDVALAKRPRPPRGKQATLVARSAQAGGAGQADGAAITATDRPFRFRNPAKLYRLKQVTITVTAADGESAPGEIDAGDLVLALDGIDAGIALDGFRGGETDTRTVAGTPDHADEILAALRADGALVASIIDRDAGDNEVSPPANARATLALRGSLPVR